MNSRSRRVSGCLVTSVVHFRSVQLFRNKIEVLFFVYRKMYSRRRLRFSVGVRFFIAGLCLVMLVFIVIFLFIVRSAYI